MEESDLSLEITRTSAPVRQEVLKVLRCAIADGRFRPGERLVERKLCSLTGVSRGPIREALRQLEAEGLILTLPNRGPVVRAITSDEAKELYQVRAVLEGLVGKLFAIRASDEDIESLREALSELEASFNGRDTEVALRAKDHLYGLLMHGCGNQTVCSFLQSLHNRITALRALTLNQPGRTADSLVEMRRIVAAIESRDPEAARQACVDHVERAAIIALDVLRR